MKFAQEKSNGFDFSRGRGKSGFPVLFWQKREQKGGPKSSFFGIPGVQNRVRGGPPGGPEFPGFSGPGAKKSRIFGVPGGKSRPGV